MKANFVYETIFQPKSEEDVNKILQSTNQKKKQKIFRSAVAKGNIYLLKMLFDTGKIDLEYRSETDGATNLMAAAYFGRPEVVKFLIDIGADVNARGEQDYRTPLLYACCAGINMVSISDYEKIVKLLINAGADVNAQDKYGYTALARWILNSSLSKTNPKKKFKIIDLLIDAGADVNIKDSTGSTALAIAYSHNKILIHNHLLSKSFKKAEDYFLKKFKK